MGGGVTLAPKARLRACVAGGQVKRERLAKLPTEERVELLDLAKIASEPDELCEREFLTEDIVSDLLDIPGNAWRR